jgi:hypothetical protein
VSPPAARPKAQAADILTSRQQPVDCRLLVPGRVAPLTGSFLMFFDAFGHHGAVALVIVYASWLTVRGLKTKPSFASWHMFSETKRATFNLCTPTSPVNPWDYLPHSGVQIGVEQALFFVQYLHHRHGLCVSGTIDISEPGGERRILVRDSRPLV